ncbi:MAG TPA: hypothetical protein VG826_31485 [Pirellulales bacterium]|nr:hypothetical protein [Pirellulales bacterium]
MKHAQQIKYVTGRRGAKGHFEGPGRLPCGAGARPAVLVALFSVPVGSLHAQEAVKLEGEPATQPAPRPIQPDAHVVMMQGGLLRGYIITTSPKTVRDWQQEQGAKQPGAVFVVQAFANLRAVELFATSWLGK